VRDTHYSTDCITLIFSAPEASKQLTRIKDYIHWLAHLEVNPEKYYQIINGRPKGLARKLFPKRLEGK
jgi:hypothetical protein